MATAQFSPNEMRRQQVSQTGSPRPKNRESTTPRETKTQARHTQSRMLMQPGEAYTQNQTQHKDTPCRNILIYGHCRYKDIGCAFSHEQGGTKGTSPPTSTSNQEQQQPQ